MSILNIVLNTASQICFGALFFLVIFVVGKLLYEIFFTDAMME